MDPINVINNPARQRFEALVDDDYAYIDYRIHRGQMFLMHTFVPEKLRGKKIADQLAKFALDYIAQAQIDVRIYCPFVTQYVQRHPEYANYRVTLTTKAPE